ncbi:hypothetical protein CLI64_13630 [Nostoc sp. CENA543]|uniref:hypothetical protein n=1 Tax=Nostoc sp. CENA543 TaxID=1869241 RepID=UPI000CA1D01F|nr:hypothetical protein [Nostoc sp. CENA543]AUT01357.1 hypothetical protein CLI64_13630 [Nostoc sp. CENA543]
MSNQMYRVFYSVLPSNPDYPGRLQAYLTNPSRVYNHYLTPDNHIPDQDFPDLTEGQAEYICLVLDKGWDNPTFKSFETKEEALFFIECLESPSYIPAIREYSNEPIEIDEALYEDIWKAFYD